MNFMGILFHLPTPCQGSMSLVKKFLFTLRKIIVWATPVAWEHKQNHRRSECSLERGWVETSEGALPVEVGCLLRLLLGALGEFPVNGRHCLHHSYLGSSHQSVSWATTCYSSLQDITAFCAELACAQKGFIDYVPSKHSLREWTGSGLSEERNSSWSKTNKVNVLEDECCFRAQMSGVDSVKGRQGQNCSYSLYQQPRFGVYNVFFFAKSFWIVHVTIR